MSEANRRLPNPGARFAYDQWRKSHPHASVDEFFRRHKHGEQHRGGGPSRKRRELERALRRAARTDLPERTRAFARADAERLKAELDRYEQ